MDPRHTTPPDDYTSELVFKRLEKYLCHADDCTARSVVGAVMGHACSCGLAQAIADCNRIARDRSDFDKK